MATLVSYFFMAIAPYFFAQAMVGVSDGGGEPNGSANVFVKVLGADAGHRVLVTSDEDGVASHGMVVAFAGDKLNSDGDSAHHQVKIIRVVNQDDADEAEHGWLGVMLVNIKARNDGEAEEGVVITDVVEGSPADLAGLQAEDVVVSIDGQDVNTNISDLVKLVSANKPGDEMDVIVLRDGDEKTFTVTLGSRAASKKMEWKFNTAPLAEIEENIHTRAKFLQRGDGGKWIFKDLGDLSSIEGLPDNIKMLMPQAGTLKMKIFVDDGEKRIQTTSTVDDVNISIEQEGDGPITVTRRDKNGEETVETYADAEELQAADEEAEEIFSGTSADFEIEMDDLDLDDLHFNFNFDIDAENLADSIDFWMQGMEDFKKANNDIEFAQLQMKDALRQMEDGGQLTEAMRQSLSKLSKLNALKGVTKTIQLDRATQSFEVRPNGMIEVKVRKGDSELIDLYENEEDLANRSPDLYRKYQELRGEMK